MLAANEPSLPFMSDEAMAASLPGPKAYTAKRYLELVTALRKKAAELGQHGERCCSDSCVAPLVVIAVRSTV